MKALILFALVAITGCATQYTRLEEADADGSYRISRSKTRTFWDSQSALAKYRTTNTDKTQSIGVDGLNQSSSGTNALTVLEAVVAGAVSVAAKAQKAADTATEDAVASEKKAVASEIKALKLELQLRPK